ncbi:M23 family metallopeptidase [Thermodesulfobacteriota bacterium]
MKNRLHIIVTGEEGGAKSFVVSKPRLKAALHFSCISIFILSALSVASITLFMQGNELKTSVNRLENNLNTTQQENLSLQEQVTILGHEKEALLQDAVTELNKRSQLIESVLSTVGVKIKTDETQENSGGPFTRLSETNHEDILYLAEQYIETVQFIPLGPPVPGTLTSKFGRRLDPMNNKPAFHEGVDIRGKMGTPVKATADGRISSKGYNKGYGWHIVIDHGNDFRTKYCHLKKNSSQKRHQHFPWRNYRSTW